MQNQHIYPLRVHIEDTDFTGLVYHPNYLKFMERARSEWITQLGLDIDWQKKHQIYFLIYSITIQFIKPARVHEVIEVVSAFKTIKSASLVFDQYLRSEPNPDKIICKGEIKIVCVDKEMKPHPIPDVTGLQMIRRELT